MRDLMLAWLALAWGGASVVQSAPPNVVIFLADDAGWGDYGANGNRTAETPRIDALARDAVTLDQFYVCPVCSPTRAEFLTSRYHLRTGVRGVSTGFERLSLDEATFVEAFQQSGYVCGIYGKWHNGSQGPYHPLARGFDDFLGYTAGHWGEYFDPPLERNGQMIRCRGYIVDVCTDAAIEFIRTQRDRPFLCYCPFTTPHSPWAAPEADWRRFEQKSVSQAATLPDQENLAETRCALAMLANQDRNVGRVLDALEELQLADNTIVVYFSDNGPNSWRWNGGMKGRKGSTDEGGVRSPCWMRWPGQLPAGHVVSEIAGAIDLGPTLLALAGVERTGDKHWDGRDLSRLLRNEESDWPERMLFSTWNGAVSVRSRTHRLDAQGNLYALTDDPGQTRSLNDEQPELRAAMLAAVDRWQADVDPQAATETGKKERRGRRDKSQVDPRPFPIGYPPLPVTFLPARDGEPRGGVRRSSTAPNCSYFVNWTSLDDQLVWKIEVLTGGRYEISIDYTCPLADAGAEFELRYRPAAGPPVRLTGVVAPGWDSPLYQNQDTLPRPAGESQMKEFRPLSVGEIELPAGQGELVLQAVRIPGRTVMDVRRVTCKLMPPGDPPQR